MRNLVRVNMTVKIKVMVTVRVRDILRVSQCQGYNVVILKADSG